MLELSNIRNKITKRYPQDHLYLHIHHVSINEQISHISHISHTLTNTCNLLRKLLKSQEMRFSQTNKLL